MANPPTPTILILIPPPLPPSSSGSLDLSPLQYVLALLALVSIPALIYAFLFAIRCPPTSSSSTAERRTTRTSHNPPSPTSSSIGNGEGTIVSEAKHDEKEMNECAVCLCGFDGGEEAKQLSVCKHSFHADCIDTWLNSNGNTCPICRASIGHKKTDASDMV